MQAGLGRHFIEVAIPSKRDRNAGLIKLFSWPSLTALWPYVGRGLHPITAPAV
jgi:hypothetical protein